MCIVEMNSNMIHSPTENLRGFKRISQRDKEIEIILIIF
jgi:hypothetical protein